MQNMAPPQFSMEDTLKAFIQGQTQINQSHQQMFQELKVSVDEIKGRLNAREGTFPAQPQPNPK